MYELDSIGLVKVLARLNQGTDWAGKNLGGATNFTIGVAVNPLAKNIDEELRRFEAKIKAGAHFAMTQPIFDPEHWDEFLKRLGGNPHPCDRRPVAADQLQAGPAAEQRGSRDCNSATGSRSHGNRRRWCAGSRVLACPPTCSIGRARRSASGIAGAYLIPPFKRYEEILELFE